MDPLSTTASVIAVIQLTSAVIGYLNDVKDAPKECQQCTIEASNLQTLLINLRYRLEQGRTGDPWYTEIRALNAENGPLDQYKRTLEQLQSKVDVGNSAKKLKRQLAWKFSKEEVAIILARMERLKTLMSIALEMDHFKLSQAIKDDTISIRNTFPTLQASVADFRNTQSLQEHHAIMEWLSPTDFPAQQHDIIARRQEGTGQWFLDSYKFNRWLQGSDKTLFCPGIPGAGKTMMAAIVIDHLRRTIQCNDIGVAYLFCNYKAQADQSAPSLLATLLKQLVQSRPDIAAPVTQIYHLNPGSKPSFGNIFRALQSVCSSYSTVYIVVDALDECADKNSARSQLIDKLRELQAGTDVRLLFTSRFISEVTQMFQSNTVLEVYASEEDVRQFVAGQMSRLPNRIQRDNALKQAILNKIVEAVDGMFLLARLHVDSLRDKRTKREVLSTLETLPKGSIGLDEAYSKATERINGQLPGDRSLGWRALSWITFAKRLLTTKELCCALAIRPDHSFLDDDDVYDVEDVISVCAELVTVDEKSNIVRLVHYTTQRYFEGELLKWNPGAQEEIAVACLTYLSFNTSRSGSCAHDIAIKRILAENAENAFFDYSARYWSDHVRPVQSIISLLALTFLRAEALVDSVAQAAHFANRTSGLHLTVRYELLYLTEKLLMGEHGDSSIEADSKDEEGRTPLSWAASGGHEAVVRLMLAKEDINPDSKDRDGWTPLSWAADEGHVAVVELFLATGNVDVNLKDNSGRTPLSWAAEKGHEAVVKLLLATANVDVHSKDGYGWTPLLWAAARAHGAVVNLLLSSTKMSVTSSSEELAHPLTLVTPVLKTPLGVKVQSPQLLQNIQEALRTQGCSGNSVNLYSLDRGDVTFQVISNSGCYQILDSTGNPILNCPSIPANGEAPGKICKLLRKLTRHRIVAALQNKESKLNGSFIFSISRAGRARRQTGIIGVSDGDKLLVEFENLSDQPLYYSLFNLTLEWEVEQLFRHPTPVLVKPRSNRSVRVGMSIPKPLCRNGVVEIEDILKVIVTTEPQKLEDILQDLNDSREGEVKETRLGDWQTDQILIKTTRDGMRIYPDSIVDDLDT